MNEPLHAIRTARWHDESRVGLSWTAAQCDEAKRRLEGLRESDRTGKLANFSADFEPTGDLGLKVWAEAEPFDAVSCMFALHYFFASESAATKMVEMIALNLREGGYFFGTLPDGKRVVETLGPEMRFEMAGLKLVPKWKGTTKPFGSAYTCAIADTVTEVCRHTPTIPTKLLSFQGDVPGSRGHCHRGAPPQS